MFEGFFKGVFYLRWWASIVYWISTSYSFQEYNPKAIDITLLIQKTRVRILWSYITESKTTSYVQRPTITQREATTLTQRYPLL